MALLPEEPLLSTIRRQGAWIIRVTRIFVNTASPGHVTLPALRALPTPSSWSATTATRKTARIGSSFTNYLTRQFFDLDPRNRDTHTLTHTLCGQDVRALGPSYQPDISAQDATFLARSAEPSDEMPIIPMQRGKRGCGKSGIAAATVCGVCGDAERKERMQEF